MPPALGRVCLTPRPGIYAIGFAMASAAAAAGPPTAACHQAPLSLSRYPVTFLLNNTEPTSAP
jgi:hypothetical protein